MKNMLRTKIIATIGPASNSEEIISELIKAGARAFRINSSHGKKEEHLEIIKKIRKVAQHLNLCVPIMFDLQGPKIRIGILKAPINLKEGDNVVLKPCGEQEDENFIPIDHRGLAEDLKEGDVVLLDDGKIELKVTGKFSDSVEAVVTDGGVLTSRKGVNIPTARINIPSITPRDIEFINFAVENMVDYFALSFVRTKEDIIKAKEYIKKAGGQTPVIAKIEKPEAVNNLVDIIMISDGIIIARGDLGIEISPERVPVVQKHIIKEANSLGKEVITATQMLESMIKEPIPTRAEASDVANAIIDGTDALLLTGETAVGEFPAKTVKMMSSIAENVENSNLCKYNTYESGRNGICNPDSQSIASAAIRIIDEIEITAIVAFTRSGFTGRLISKAKPSVPVIAISDRKDICEQLSLLWGIEPFYMEFSPNFTEEFLRQTDEFLVKNTFLENNDKIIITGGMPCLATGTTNFIRIHEIGSL